MLALLLGCGLRRSELVELDVDRIQQREHHGVILDLIGKRRSSAYSADAVRDVISDLWIWRLDHPGWQPGQG